MAIPVKAPVGQRVVTALIMLLCLLAAVALLRSAVLATWFGVALTIVALCGAYVFAHVTVLGSLPGHFRAGGNAFIGAGQNVGIKGAYRSAPIWQRTICGVLAVCGGIAIVVGLVTGRNLGSYASVASLVLALGGFYLFGYIALRGHLPSPQLGGGNAALNHHSRRGGG